MRKTMKHAILSVLLVAAGLVGAAQAQTAPRKFTATEELAIRCYERIDRMDEHLANAIDVVKGEDAASKAKRKQMEADYDVMVFKMAVPVSKAKPQKPFAQSPEYAAWLEDLALVRNGDSPLRAAERSARAGDLKPMKALIKRCDAGLGLKMLPKTWGDGW